MKILKSCVLTPEAGKADALTLHSIPSAVVNFLFVESTETAPSLDAKILKNLSAPL